MQTISIACSNLPSRIMLARNLITREAKVSLYFFCNKNDIIFVVIILSYMRLTILILFTVLSLSVIFAGPIQAVDPTSPQDSSKESSACSTGAGQLCDPLGAGGNFTTVANRIIKYAIGLVGVLALIAFVWGGIEWMISGGDSKKIQKGKDMMIWAVFGMVFIFGSYALINLVLKALAG